MKTVIILDGHLRSALAAVRSLGAAGYQVVCGSHRRTGLALFSQHTHRRFRYPSPLQSLVGFQQAVAAMTRQYDDPIVYAFSDATFLALNHSEHIAIAFDKRRTVVLAQELGIPVPRTSDALPTQFPAVIKPRHTVCWREDRGVRSDVHIIASTDEAARVWHQLEQDTGETPFSQEYISAIEYGVAVLCDHGRIIARCVHRRVRSLSPSGGASAVRVTVDAPPGIMESAEKLMQRLSWHGVAMIEFRVGTADRVPYLVEINGRFWGSLALAQYAGVNFSGLYAELMQGYPISAPEYRRDVYARYLLGDILHLVRSPRSLGAFLSYGGANHFYDVESWRDPLPMLMDIVDKIY